MARIRSTHPDQWTDVEFVGCSPLARLLALAIRNFADDNGILPYDMVRWKLQALPGDNCDMKKLARELVAARQVFVYEADGREYAIIRNFTRFQSPKAPTYTHPPPENAEMDGRKVLRIPESNGVNGVDYGNPPAGNGGREGGDGRSPIPSPLPHDNGKVGSREAAGAPDGASPRAPANGACENHDMRTFKHHGEQVTVCSICGYQEARP